MGVLIVLLAVLGSTFGAPYGGYSQLPLVQYVAQPIYTQVPVNAPIVTGNLQHTLDTLGQYKYTYSSSDGQAKTEHRQVDGGVSGQFSYMSPEGNPISLSYTADKDGFRPVGAHLPVAPEVPPMPADLALAYQQSNERLAKEYQEASLRKPNEGAYIHEVPRIYAAPVIPVKSGYVYTNAYY